MLTKYRYLVLDALNHAHRSWWGVRSSVTTDGRDNSLEAGFVGRLLDFRRRHPGADLVLAWDGEPVRQRAEHPGYKEGRAQTDKERPADWHERCVALRQALSGLFPTLHDPCDEADVEIARFVKARGGSTVLVSSDADLLVLLSPGVDILRPGKRPEVYRLADFQAEYGFPPHSLVLYRALTGDRSDRLGGVPYFPTKVAGFLAAECDTVDRLYEALRQPHPTPSVALLTDQQKRKLLANEPQVRSNARLLDLLADGGAPHLHMPPGDIGPLNTLLAPLQLEHLTTTLEWDLLVERARAGKSTRTFGGSGAGA